jgi:hypothetical protein
MRGDDRRTGGREGGMRHDIDPDESSEGDRVTVGPTLADEEIVPPDQYEGDLDEDDI